MTRPGPGLPAVSYGPPPTLGAEPRECFSPRGRGRALSPAALIVVERGGHQLGGCPGHRTPAAQDRVAAGGYQQPNPRTARLTDSCPLTRQSLPLRAAAKRQVTQGQGEGQA